VEIEPLYPHLKITHVTLLAVESELEEEWTHHNFIEKHGTFSVQSTHLQPMWPGLEFVVGSRSCFKGFSLGFTFPPYVTISKFDLESEGHRLFVRVLHQNVALVHKADFLFISMLQHAFRP